MLTPCAAQEEDEGTYITVRYTEQIEVSHSNSGRVQLNYSVPKDYPGRQEVQEINYSIEPMNESSINGQNYAHYSLSGTEDFELTVEVEVRIYQYDYNTALTEPAGDIQLFPSDRRLLLREDRNLEVDNPQIQDLAQELTQGVEGDIEKLRILFDYCIENIEYQLMQEEKGALFALENGTGDCSEFSFLMVALARAAGIPARVVSGIAFYYDEMSLGGHQIVEAYIDGIGWFPMDPTWGAVGRDEYFAEMYSQFIYISFNPNRGFSPDSRFVVNYYANQEAPFITGDISYEIIENTYAEISNEELVDSLKGEGDSIKIAPRPKE